MPNSTGTTLLELTEVTRNHLRDVAGSLWALWATAQQINARQKVELSIRCVFSGVDVHGNYDTSHIFFDSSARASRVGCYPYNLTSQARLTINIEYWRDLGESVFFRGHTLGDCIARIHDDVLKVWNFNDPLKVSACYRQTKGNDFDVHSPATFRSGILRRDDKTCRTFT